MSCKELKPQVIKDIETPYGPAVQSDAPEALALENPNSAGYAQRYGIPQENIENANFIETAVMKPGTPFITRPAPGIVQNIGGGIEVVVPENGVNMKYFGTK